MRTLFYNVRRLLDVDFSVSSWSHKSTIQVKDGRIYFWFTDINTCEAARLLLWADKCKLPVENYNVTGGFENFIREFLMEAVDQC